MTVPRPLQEFFSIENVEYFLQPYGEIVDRFVLQGKS